MTTSNVYVFNAQKHVHPAYFWSTSYYQYGRDEPFHILVIYLLTIIAAVTVLSF